MSDDLFLHFEVIPDHLPDALKAKIAEFPKGVLQFEIGIQTFNEEVQRRISRKQNNDLACENLRWIRNSSGAYIHADLIYGLPGETTDSFAYSFNRLYELRPHEIQVGILKRLKGSPIIRHVEEFDLVFNPNPPFNILKTSTCGFDEVQAMNRFARYWDLIANSGRFKRMMKLLLTSDVFHQFMQITEALYDSTGQTHKISLLRLYDLVYEIGCRELGADPELLLNALSADHAESGLKSLPKCLSGRSRESKRKSGALSSRQARHLT